jgi:hypothetical protein
MKAIAASLATALILVGAAWAHGLTAAREDAALQPPCAQAGYGADGDMSPLFCVVDNPVALRYFAPMGKHLFALGPNANPQQVVAAAVADRKTTGTLPILCSTYRLAAWREHWQFAVSAAAQIGAALHFYRGWCSDPNFKISD